MREYMTALGSVLMIIALSNILLGEGGIKKFASLAMGFILISTVISPLPLKIDGIKAEFGEIEINEEQIAKNQAQYKAQIIKKQSEILEEKIKEHIKHGSYVKVELSPDGEIISVTINALGDESGAVFYIVDTLKVPRERIKLIYGNN